MDISFTKDISDPFAMLNNIREIQKIVNSIRPALDQCSTSQTNIDFTAVDKVLKMITEPTTSELYDFSLKIVKNLPRI